MTSVRYWSMACVGLVCLILVTVGCDVISGPGTLTGTVRYAKDPAGSLEDPQNAGDPAAGIKVIAYGTELQVSSGGPSVYVENQAPAKEIVTDEQGRYEMELPSGHYVVRLGLDPERYHLFVDVGPNRTSTMDFIVLRASGR